MMDNDKIIEYIMDTPENTNPNILNEMLNKAAPAATGGVTYVHAPGIAVAVIFSSFIDPETFEPPVLDMTFSEITDALNTGSVILTDTATYDDVPEQLKDVYPQNFIGSVYGQMLSLIISDVNYRITFGAGTAGLAPTFITNNENGYPVLYIGDGGDDTPVT